MNVKKIYVLLILVLLILSCSERKVLKELDFCKMLQEDQSNMYKPGIDDSVNRIRHNERKKIFIHNYSSIIEYSKEHGFPIVEQDLGKSDSCRYWAIYVTFIHVAQAIPDLFYSEDNVDFLESELIRGNLDKGILTSAVKMGLDGEVCDTLLPNIEKALDKWSLKKFGQKIKVTHCE